MSTIRISRYKQEALADATNIGQAPGVGFIAAVFLHIGLLLLIIIMQQHVPVNRKLPPSVQVNLVSYSPKLENLLKSEKAKPKKKVKKKVAPKKKPKPIKKPVEKPPVKQEKVFAEKKTPESAKVVAPEEEVKEKAEDPDQNKIRDILAELQAKVDEQAIEDDYEEEEIEETVYRPWSDVTAQSIYNGIFTTMIQKNWVFNENLAQIKEDNDEINVLVMIKIMKNGDLGDIWIETKSGNDFLDRSAIRAIKKAAPFPPLPKELQLSSYEVGLLFSPKGLK